MWLRGSQMFCAHLLQVDLVFKDWCVVAGNQTGHPQTSFYSFLRKSEGHSLCIDNLAVDQWSIKKHKYGKDCLG